MNQNHSLNMEPSPPPFVFQSQPEPESLSVFLARTSLFIFLFGLVCLLLNVDRNTLGTVLIGVALVFVFLSMKKIIKGNWRRRRTRQRQRSSDVRICVPTSATHQWTRIFRGGMPIENNQLPQSSFTSLDELMHLSERLYPPVNPMSALLPPSYEQAVAEMEQPSRETETHNNAANNEGEQTEAPGSNGDDTEAKSASFNAGTNAEAVQ